MLGQSRVLDRLFSPVIYILYPIPKIVFLPVILLLLGIGNVSKIFIIFLILFFQILVVVRDEASALRPELIYSVRSLGAGRRALFRFVYLPATVPAALTALRVSVGTAIAVLFFAESFATTSGLGYYIIVESWGRLAYPEMYAGVVAMSLLGLLLYFVVDRPGAPAGAVDVRMTEKSTSCPSATLPPYCRPRSEKRCYVRRMFAAIAPRYDLMNRLMTLGRDQVWRRRPSGSAALPRGGRLLDVATGTGDIAYEALRQGRHPPGHGRGPDA